MDKLELQSACFDNIKTLCVNYRKDSSSRKTVDYLRKRLSSLEDQWNDFESRHALLVLELEDKNITYFVDNVYEKTKDMYVSTKSDMSMKLSELEQQSQVKFDLSGTEDIQPRAEDSNRLQLLLNKQECNFNAMYRVLSKIDPSLVSEKWELDDNLSILKSKWEPIDKLHWEIDFQLKGSNEHYYKMFTEVENKYDDLKKKINAKLWSTVHFQKSAPKIDIPEFSGNYSQWISFKDLFLEAIHKNPMINSAQKMQHLKAKLRGEAERLVQHLTISADNYKSCWEILNQRFDNRRLQFTSFMNTMLNLPVIQSPDSFNLKKMHDVITECLNGISNIGIDTTSWDPIIVHIMSQKLDSHTLSDYMKELQDHRELQNLHDFLYFLETQFMAYETMKSTKKVQPVTLEKTNWKFNKQTPMKKHNYTSKSFNYLTTYTKCPLCNGNHVLMQCEKFIEMDINKRNNTVFKLQVCKNCLFSHGNNNCMSTKSCRECNMKHHTLLHKTENKNIMFSNKSNDRSSSSSQLPTANHLHTNNIQILLTTVQLKIKSFDGTYVTLRALLDQGSQVNLITENAAQLLRLPRKTLNACVTGIGAVTGDCRGQLHLNCKSIYSDFNFATDALIMKKLTNNLPATSFEKGEWPHLQNLKLADPDFNISQRIDLLLGADVYSEIILDGVLKGNHKSPVAQQTQIGWILCGKMKTFNCNVTLFNMEELTKFWETEDIIQTSQDISIDDQCEQFYRDTVQRSQDGKYIVKMPFHSNIEEKLGKSRSTAVSQFLQLEKRLDKNNNYANMYRKFIEEYAELGHMKPTSQLSTNNICYFPHHGVLRENSTTTKLRVVFNASQKTSTGCSLNSLMEKGAKLQQDIQALVLRWRTYKFVFTADIEKMYRCIWIAEDQRDLQRIIWRNSRNDTLQDFQLCTLTYGTKCAPWLAMRTLKQLAIDEGHKYPEAAKILQAECYIDDVISGHNCLNTAQALQESLIKLLQEGGMNLRKWTSNHEALLENLREDQISSQGFNFKNNESSKTLGLVWKPSSDTFHFNWPLKHSKRLTKRLLLSEISTFFDPLGWLAPVTVTAKLLFQKLWISKLHWDDEVGSDIESEWLKLKEELPIIKDISINRWIGNTQQQVELFGFCDASEKAYACVVYSKTIDEQGQSVITILASKTRVAPLTQKTTLPRLELCGALLLVELMEKIKKALHGYHLLTHAWSDSQVVLAWIKGDSSRWEPYIANRVTKIKRVIPASLWNYVKSEHNPADCASRGLSPNKLMTFNLWWKGPEFLRNQNQDGNSHSFKTDIGCINHINSNQNLLTYNEHILTTLLNKCSSLTRMTRVFAWIQRFITNNRLKVKSETSYLTTSEQSAATRSIVIFVQQSQFDTEFNQLHKKEMLSKKSSIYKLNPYLDNQGIIRVGGRLKNSILPSDYNDTNHIDLRRRWQLIEHMVHQYWKNWSNDYLSTLQLRNKWNKPTKNIKEGDIVLVKDNNLPPGKWVLGRVLKTHPGMDGYVRVTTIKTKGGIIKRPIVKLSPLPMESEVESGPVQNIQTDQKQRSPEKQRDTRRINISTFLLTLLTMFTFLPGSYCSIDGVQAPAPGDHITSLERQRPIYYDTMGTIQTIHDEWILIMYYNLTNYWDGTKHLETYFENLKNLCYSTQLQHCKTTMGQLQHEMEIIYYYNSVFINPHKHLSNRKKRGLVDGVGYIANSLFGILDQRFADKYQKDIQSIQSNENYILDLIKNQTTIVELENHVLMKGQDNIQRQFKLINSFINQTNMNMASIETEMDVLYATTYFNSASLTAYLLINSLRTFQEMLFNTLTNVYQGHIDIHLITPVHLIEQLNEISGSLPKTVSLPVQNYKENIKDIYKVISVKARVTENYFLFEAHIPLVSNDDYIFYHAIPLPITQNKETTYVQLSSKYIAVNLKKNIYISLSDEEFNQCMKQKSNNYLCKKNLPSFELHSKNAPCEAKPLSHHNNEPCDVERLGCKDAWIELQTTNSWLAICCNTCPLRTICSNDVTSYTMTLSSIVSLSEDCVLQSKDLTIHSHRQYNSNIRMDYEFTVPDFNRSINKLVNLTYHSAPNNLQSTDLEIMKIEDEIRNQRKNEAQFTTISSHDVHQYVITYLLLASAIITVAVVVARNRCHFCKPPPTNRVTTNDQRSQDIELQVIQTPRDYPESPSYARVERQTGSSRRSIKTGTKNIAFNFD